MIDEQELNKKLAEWAGWTRGEWISQSTDKPFDVYGNHIGHYWQIPNCGGKRIEEPELPFTQSLDACFKWLEPGLDYVRLEMLHEPYPKSLEGYTGKKAYRATVKYVNRIKDHCCEEPALALCLAIEELIDNQ